MNKINFKLLNTLITIIIIYLLWLIKDLWVPILSKLVSALFPFIIAFIIAYLLYPLLKLINKYNVRKSISILIIVFIVMLSINSLLYLFIFNILPAIYNELPNILSSIKGNIQNISIIYNINLDSIINYINNINNSINNNTINYGNLITQSLGYLTNIIIIFIASVYLLANMDNISKSFKNYIDKNGNKKLRAYLKEIDLSIHNYVKAFVLFAIIMFIQYTLIYFIIGHPQYLLLGFIAFIATFIPYFGGFITNIIAIGLASLVSNELMIITILIALIFPNIDGYFTMPKVFSKINKIPPLLVIFSVFTGAALFGIIGIVLSIPIVIIILITLKTYKDEIIKIFKK